jgi:Stage II sporulation protein E (SpoIIE)
VDYNLCNMQYAPRPNESDSAVMCRGGRHLRPGEFRGRAAGESELWCTAQIGHGTVRAAAETTEHSTSRLRFDSQSSFGAPTGRLRPNVQTLAALAPFLVMATVATADLCAGPSLRLLPLLSLSPALGAVSLSPRSTAMTGVVAGLACLPLAAYDGVLETQRTAIAIAAVAGVTGTGVVASLGRLRRERELADARAVADAMQRILLRPVPERLGSIAIAVRYTGATTSAPVGGDLYDVIQAAGKVRLIIADVQGLGLAAAGTAAIVLGAFREAAHDAPGLTDIAARIELSLQRHKVAEEFVTAILAEASDDSCSVELLNCGHPPPLLLSAGTVRFMEQDEPGLPLGLAQLRSCRRETLSVSLRPGDRALFYTDGVSEARNESGDFYPLSDAADLLRTGDLPNALDRLGADIIRYRGQGLRDDVTMVLIARLTGESELPDRSIE